MQQRNTQTQTTGVSSEEQQLLSPIITQALENLPASVIICEISQNDPTSQKMIFANRAFHEMTKYGNGELLGRNCNQMQYEGNIRHCTVANEAAKLKIVEAVKNKEKVSVVLENYKKDGTWFLNSLTLIPLEIETPPKEQEDTGRNYYMGIQKDITYTPSGIWNRYFSPHITLLSVVAALTIFCIGRYFLETDDFSTENTSVLQPTEHTVLEGTLFNTTP